MSDSPSSGGCFSDLDTRRVTLTTREARMGEPKFWDVPDRAREVVKEVNTLKNWIEPYDRLDTKLREMTELKQMLTPKRTRSCQPRSIASSRALDEQTQVSFELRSLL